MHRDLWLNAWHIPGEDNLTADILSRKFDDLMKWVLSKSVIDLFATRLNKQIDMYCFWHLDLDALYVNAFSFFMERSLWLYQSYIQSHWTYAYGEKICQDHAECVLVAPVWPTQPWFNRVLEILVDHPVILPVTDNLLTLPGTDVQHPLKNSLVLMVCRLSGCSSKKRNFSPSSLDPVCIMEGQNKKRYKTFGKRWFF